MKLKRLIRSYTAGGLLVLIFEESSVFELDLFIAPLQFVEQLSLGLSGRLAALLGLRRVRHMTALRSPYRPTVRVGWWYRRSRTRSGVRSGPAGEG